MFLKPGELSSRIGISIRLINANSLFCIFLSSLFLLLPACKTLETYHGDNAIGVERYQMIEDGGWVTVFLNLKQAIGPEMAMTISAVEIGSGENWLQLNRGAITLDSKQIRGRQVFVARMSLLPGEYDSLRFVLEKASMKSGKGMQALILEAETVEMVLPRNLNLQNNDSQSLFVTWDVLASLARQNKFKAAMSVHLQAIPLVVDLAFVACPDLDSIYVIRTDKNWVISSIPITGRPTYLNADPNLNRLYILASEENAIMVYDLNTNKLADKIFIPMDNYPSFMTMGPDSKYAYIADRAGKSMVRVDVINGVVEERESFFFKPNYVTFLQDQGQLAVSAEDRNFVYILSSDTLQVINTIAVGSSPQGVFSESGLLFVAESGANTLSAYNLSDGSQEKQINVGLSPARLLIKNNHMYVTNLLDGSVTTMLPNQLNVLSEQYVGGRPQELTSPNTRPWIYITNTESGGVTVINSASKRIAGFVELAATTLGIAVID